MLEFNSDCIHPINLQAKYNWNDEQLALILGVDSRSIRRWKKYQTCPPESILQYSTILFHDEELLKKYYQLY